MIIWDYIKRTKNNRTFYVPSKHIWINRSAEPRKDVAGIFNTYQCSECKINGKCYIQIYPDRIQVNPKFDEALINNCITSKLKRTK